MKSAACQLRPVFPYTPTNLRCDWDRPPSPTVIPVKSAATTSGCSRGGSAMQTGPSGVPPGGLRQQPSRLRQQPEDLSEGQNRSCQVALTNGNCFLPLTELPVNCLRSTPTEGLDGDPTGTRVAHDDCHEALAVFAHDSPEFVFHRQLTAPSSSPARPPPKMEAALSSRRSAHRSDAGFAKCDSRRP